MRQDAVGINGWDRGKVFWLSSAQIPDLVVVILKRSVKDSLAPWDAQQWDAQQWDAQQWDAQQWDD